MRTTSLVLSMLLLLAGLQAALPQERTNASAAIVLPSFTNHVAPGSFANGAGEPSIGVNWNTGKVFFQAGPQTYRIDFSVSPPTWVSVKPPNSIVNVDPILFTDPISGRTFAGGLAGECSILAYTDTDGASWTPMTNSCASPAWDHETIGGGAWHAPRPAAATHDRAVYYCAQEMVQQCSVSYNGGLSFGAGVPLRGCTGLVGHVKVAPDGTAYVPSQRCGGRQGAMVSTDNGVTWQMRTVPGSGIPGFGFDPSVGISKNGRVYFAWQNWDNAQMIAASDDGGITWTTPRNVGAVQSLRATTFSSVVAGDDDRAAVAFLGTRDAGTPFQAGFTGVWHLFVSITYDGGATWHTVQVSTDPVQRGYICTQGINCGGGRNLLDFFDAAIDTSGRVLVAYADGCLSTCAGPSGTVGQSTSEKGVIARQSGGSTLYAALDAPGASAPSAPELFSDGWAGKVELQWTVPKTFGTPITGYQVYRSVGTRAGSAPYALVGPGVTTYTDTAVTSNTTYYYEVTALSAAGASGKSGQPFETPRDGVPPTAPRDAKATPALLPTQQDLVSVSWNAPADPGTWPVTEYRVWRGIGGGPKTLIATVTGYGYTDYVEPGLTYHYQVSAVSDSGISPLSNEATASR